MVNAVGQDLNDSYINEIAEKVRFSNPDIKNRKIEGSTLYFAIKLNKQNWKIVAVNNRGGMSIYISSYAEIRDLWNANDWNKLKYWGQLK